jgi:preprotein translocase subunit SecD
MRKSPRKLFWFIILLAFLAVFINLPSSFRVNPDNLLSRLKIDKKLMFREGLDLKGGVSLTFQADLSDIKNEERPQALESAKNVIERRVNLYGVSEPIVQTSVVGNDSRILVELPGVGNINQAIDLVGTTAKLSFWEQGASESAVASPSALPIGIPETLGLNAKETNLTGADLQSASVTYSQNTAAPEVSLTFSTEGTKKFGDITKRNVGKPVAIVLDGVVITYPRVNEPILTGTAVISGGFTVEQAKQLSTQLNGGALPVPLSILEQRVIGPTLGLESLKKSLFAGIIGFITIIIFMVAYYKRYGIVASLALTIYALLVLAIFKLSSVTPYGITLTLAGIAGFILSIGMAVDANILIFERMKEEKRLGKTEEMATEIGFSKAWTSIRDSNISTLITSLILYTFGTGVVKGFALVLAIGVLVSMFSAITVTRTFLRVLYTLKK